MNALGIFGTSGFAREVGDIADELGYRVVYIARDEPELSACTLPGDVMLERDIGNHPTMRFAIGIGDNIARQRVAERFSDRLDFVNLIHPSATFGSKQRDAICEKSGVIVCAGVRFTSNIRVGNFTVFNLNATIGHDVIIDDFVNISPGVNISGNVHIKVRCLIGTGAAVNQGSVASKLVIGADTVVGSGSVVVKDCESNAVYVGIPARRIK